MGLYYPRGRLAIRPARLSRFIDNDAFAEIKRTPSSAFSRSRACTYITMFKSTGSHPDDGTLVAMFSGASGRLMYRLATGSAPWNLHTFHGNTTLKINQVNVIADDAWYCCALSIDGSQGANDLRSRVFNLSTLVKDADDTATTTTDGTFINITFGRRLDSSGDEMHDGSFCHSLYIDGRVLSDAEIVRFMRRPLDAVAAFGSEVLFYIPWGHGSDLERDYGPRGLHAIMGTTGTTEIRPDYPPRVSVEQRRRWVPVVIAEAPPGGGGLPAGSLASLGVGV